jgi:chemotaxis protein methyltransferase CheR
VKHPSISDNDARLLLSDVHELYGYDFTRYSMASIKRRILRLLTLDNFPSFAELRYRIKTDSSYLPRFIEEITVNVTEMFRDPSFYEAMRKKVLPTLNTYPLIRIWHAGCATGEEVYSMAIVLKEENLYHKSLIYATDINPSVLDIAKQGLVPLKQMKQYSENYINSGGKMDFSSYYSANYQYARFDPDLSKNMIFSTHNLATDTSFNEFQLIICRNVLIYFDSTLQEKTLKLFNDSLEPLGFLVLGSKETLRFSAIANKYVQVGTEKIWRKV